MRLTSRICLSFCVVAQLSFVVPTDLFAAGKVLTTAGIQGDVDKKDRGPLLSVSTSVDGTTAKIVADAVIPNKDFQKYPIQFDFFVNRKLFSSQIRSIALPGPIGIDVGPDTATLPFNYTVVAKLLHPNREFTTVLEGAVFSSQLAATLDCTVVLKNSDDEETTTTFTSKDTDLTQPSESVVSLDFSAQTEADDESIDVTGPVTINDDNEASSTLSIVRDGETTSTAVEGTVTRDGGELTALELSSEDESVSLSCETAAE